MSDTTIDWRDYIVDTGYFKATFNAQALGDDLLTVIGVATVEVSASAGESEGVMLEFDAPQPVSRYEAVWFTLDGAREYAAAVDAASAAAETTSVQLQAWCCDDQPEPVVVEVATEPDEFDGVYLDIGAEQPAPVLVGRQDAAEAAQAFLAAVDYLIAHDAK